jgi:allantoinase
MANDLIIRGNRVVTPETVRPAAAHCRNGVITAVTAFDDISPGVPVVEAGDAVVMAGLVDTHVHVNEPGRTAWEGYATATQAAAAGGVTMLVDMPLNSIPPTTTRAGLEEKLAAARGQCWVDVGFWGGVVPGNLHELEPLMASGARGFKCFLAPSGVDEFPHVTENELRPAMAELKRLGAVLLVHAELPGPIDAATATLGASPAQDYQTFLRSRPPAAENEAVALMVCLCRETGARVHIVHHSSAEALPLLREAKDEGLPLTAETCPHYLTFAAEDIPPGATHFKCCPPVRERANREKLWEAFGAGLLDLVVTDHSPCTPALKLLDEGDFMQAWGGIAALQFGLPVMWTQAQTRGYGLRDIARWMCEGPARLAGLDARKGRLAPGYDADIIVWQPEREFTITPDAVRHKHKITPYSGLNLRGVVEATFLRGAKIYEHGQVISNPVGRLII